jgi:hypothetical protein
MTDSSASQNSNQADEPLARCAGCETALASDQRYCLQCGMRNGQPRIDFTAFWKSSSGHAPEGSALTARASALRAPSRLLSAVIAAGVLSAGIALGAGMGPPPSTSLAGTARLAPLTALLSSARAQTSASANQPRATPAPIPQTSLGAIKALAHKHKLKDKPSSSKAPGASAVTLSQTESPKEAPAAGKPPAPEKPAPKHKQSAPLTLPRITHVWLIVLSEQSLTEALTKRSAETPYLNELAQTGTLLSDYSLVASSAPGNDIALLSGQGQNPSSEKGCPTYSEVQPTTISPKGLAEGSGCVYPQALQTLADQLSSASLTWKAYMQDMAPTGTGARSTGSPAEASSGPNCRHPALGTGEPASTPTTGQDYLSGRNPFVYFDSLLSSGACASDDVDSSELTEDLASTASTPNFSWIVPSACHDGAPIQCVPGGPSGLAAANAFLREVVPSITSSSDYSEHGLIVITSDSPPSTASAGPSSSAPPAVGALLLSPFVAANAELKTSFNVFSLLKSLERLYGVPLLGHAADPGIEEFGASVYAKTQKAASAASDRDEESHHG